MFDLFVYGTLKPGHQRWPILENFSPLDAARHQEKGVLYSFAGQFPVADLDSTQVNVVRGWVVSFYEYKKDTILDILDTIEGVDLEMYKRTTLDAGIIAYTGTEIMLQRPECRQIQAVSLAYSWHPEKDAAYTPQKER